MRHRLAGPAVGEQFFASLRAVLDRARERTPTIRRCSRPCAAEESAVIDNAADGVVVSKGTSTSVAASGTIARSVVRGTKFDPVRQIGRGIEVGGSVTRRS